MPARSFIRFGIRARLIILVLALLMPFVAYLLYAAKMEEKMARENALNETLVFARLFAARIDDHVSQIGQLLDVVSNAVSFGPKAAPANDRFLRSLKKRLPKYVGELAVWTPDGTNIGILSPVGERGRPNAGNWHFFREALNTRGWAVDGPFLSSDGREFNIIFTQSVIDARGVIAGVVSASLKLSDLRDVLGRGTTLPTGTISTLLNAQGIVLARSLNPEIWIGETLIGTLAIREALKQRDGTLALLAEDGVPRLAGFSTATYVPWMVYIGTPTDVALAPVNARLQERLMMSGMVLLALLLIAVLLGERISQPLRQLAADAKTFGEGALDHRTNVKVGGETGVLAATLNQMAAAIQARTGALAASEAEARRAEQALKASESRLRQSETRLRTIIESEPDCVMVLGRDGQVQEINAAGLKFAEALAPGDLQQGDVSALVSPEYRDHVLHMHQRVIAGETVTFDFELVGLKGTRRWMSCVAAPLPDERGNVIGQLAIARDITERKRSADRIEYLATRDVLTGLPNRALLGDRLNQALAVSHRDSLPLAVMFIDLDRFKNINDSLGHHAGDALLRETALRLARCLRENDTVARQGGDEFIVLLSDSDGAAAALVAQKILDAVTRPVLFEGRELVVQASIGIALFPQHGDTASMLLGNADAAMYQAKEAGRNNFQFFHAQMSQAAQSRLAMEGALRRALTANELQLHFEPQVTMATAETAGYDVQVRWAHPERGLLGPAAFMAVADETGLIVPLNEWALRDGCARAASWQGHGRRLPFAFNISARQIHDSQFADMVSRIVGDTGCDPRLLELEMAEPTLTQHHAAVYKAMQSLAPMGIGLSISGFGKSYACLAHLKRLPIRKLKLDPALVSHLDDPRDAAILRSTLQLARSLSLQVVAEGIETPAQFEFLRDAGCDLVSGYARNRVKQDGRALATLP